MLSKLIPAFIKKPISNFISNRYHKKWQDNYIPAWRSQFFYEREEYEKQIPKYDLEQKHINNLTVLLNRKELLKRLPVNAVCAELGVDEGEFSRTILEITKPEKLHLIDAWGNPDRYHDGLKIMVSEKFKTEIEKGQVEMNIGFSIEVANKFPDNYFDWVYLDTDHTYLVTADELNVLKNKVKPGGIIAGHDYIIGNWAGDCRYGVIEAVHELCVKENWELLYVTINKNEMPSFAIRRIQ